jgi:hypothetical protein
MNIERCVALVASLGTGLVAPRHARTDAFAFKELHRLRDREPAASVQHILQIGYAQAIHHDVRRVVAKTVA